MSFQSLGFLVFLAAGVWVYRLLEGFRLRRSSASAGSAAENALPLTLFSLFFYWQGCGGLPDLLPIGADLLVTWSAVRYLQSGREHRKPVFALAAGWQIAVLLLYKYAAFFTGGRVAIASSPLGLSFFTFQQLWLLKEVYGGSFILERGLGSGYMLYSLFFPTVVSGPILKPQNFFPQLRQKPSRMEAGDFAAGLYALSLGMAKKVLLADPLGTVVSNGWGLGNSLTAPAAWVVILGYTLQLYLDFSGYCDIASGCARLLGFRLPINFDAPYRALSVGEFWKRWHITLTAFLRECVYIPLGGSRRGTVRTYINILTVYLISGLWHGAGWTFLVWGGLHGLAQVAERLWGSRRERVPRALRWCWTFLFVNLAWVFFQAPSLPAAGMLLRSAVCGGPGLPLEALAAGALDSEATALRTLLPFAAKAVPGLVLAALFTIGLAVSLRRQSAARQMENFRPSPGKAAACGILLAWSVLSFSSAATFIYSNF
jgi:D-alanyl-lipoteichoic acid acyltransferase DltB (MBOAT superfamily)